MFERFRLFKQTMNEVRIEELPQFLDEKFRDETENIRSELFSNSKDTYATFSQIKQIALEFKLKSSPNRYATILKDKFCDKIIQTVDGLYMPKDDYENLSDFFFLAQQSMKTIGSMGLKEFRHLHEFKEDMGKIAEKIKVLENNVNSSNKIISSSNMPKIETIKFDINQITNIKKNIDELDRDVSILENSLLSIENFIGESKKKKDVHEIEISKYIHERQKISDLDDSLQSIKQQIDNEFSGLDRVMKKFVYFGELTKEETHILKEYIEDCGEAFLHKDENCTIKSILIAINDYKDRNVIDLDEKKAERVKDLIRQIDFLFDLRKHYSVIKSEKDEAEADLNRKIEPLRTAIKMSTSESGFKEKEKTTIQNKINGKKVERSIAEKQAIDLRSKVELEVSGLFGNQLRLV